MRTFLGHLGWVSLAIVGLALGGCMGVDQQSGDAPRSAIPNGLTFVRTAEAVTKVPVSQNDVRSCLQAAFNSGGEVSQVIEAVMAGVGSEDPMSPLTADAVNALSRIAGCFCERPSRFGATQLATTLYAGINFNTRPEKAQVQEFMMRLVPLTTATPKAALAEPVAAAVDELMKITTSNKAIWVGACFVALTSFHAFDR